MVNPPWLTVYEEVPCRETETVLGASPARSLSTGVTRTDAVPRTWFLGMVRVKSEVFSCDIRRVRAVSVSTAVPEANSAVTVIEDAPAFSAREVCTPAAVLVSTVRSITVGAASLSVMATAASAVRPNSVPVNFTFSVDAS